MLIGCGQVSPEKSTLQTQTSTQTEDPSETAPVVEDSDRTSWQKPGLIIDKLGDIQNKTIADIGAGTGYFSFQLMRKAKKVIAIDIDPNMIKLMEAFRNSLSEKRKSQIEIRLAQPHDPNLRPKESDIALFVNVVPYMENRVEYFTNLKTILNQNGSVMIVDFKVRRLPIDAPPYENRTLPHIIEEELYLAGFESIQIDDATLDYQYIITAQ